MKCNCSSKCGLLGGLEQQIMDVLWSSSKPLKPSDVLSQLKGKYAYTTIMTVLKRLADKKIVKRKFATNAYFYSPVQDKDTYACHCLDDLFTRLLNSYGHYASDSFHRVSKSFKS
ncbi:hypothetical protein A3K55_00060 [Candidatus Shapirobacteria bacterium RBG_13_44_7]|uniref:CopY family transcriptional regulator n=1 Tax=Candidatus Shapirobacteria bacterium RBG_13_44_7 TaxID=1802149 RepID=A0A1F7SEI4_9BACT|nr:MAG: hypothetical protein A3K55_00060 [Candidatus Shapirobacteria bacterium RBG_13_44_7]